MPRTRYSVPPYFSQTTHFDVNCQVDAASISAGSLDFAHALFAPLHYTPGYAYPLIVWLHGRGSDERQLQRIMPVISMQNYVAAAPQGLLMPSDDAAAESYGWAQDAETIGRAEQRVFETIELAHRKFHVNKRRIFISGFDSGGTMAFRVAMSHPQSFAGVILGVRPLSQRRNAVSESDRRPPSGNVPGHGPDEPAIRGGASVRRPAAAAYRRPVGHASAVPLGP